MSKILIFLSLIFFSGSLFGQGIKGKIYSQNTKEALSGVSIRIKGSISKGTATDEKGEFNFESVPQGKYTVIASYVCFETYQSTLILDNKGTNQTKFIITVC